MQFGNPSIPGVIALRPDTPPQMSPLKESSDHGSNATADTMNTRSSYGSDDSRKQLAASKGEPHSSAHRSSSRTMEGRNSSSTEGTKTRSGGKSRQTSPPASSPESPTTSKEKKASSLRKSSDHTTSGLSMSRHGDNRSNLSKSNHSRAETRARAKDTEHSKSLEMAASTHATTSNQKGSKSSLSKSSLSKSSSSKSAVSRGREARPSVTSDATVEQRRLRSSRPERTRPNNHEMGESLTSIQSEHTASSRTSRASMMERQASYRRQRSRSRGRNADRNRPSLRQKSIGRSTPTTTYRAPALYHQYEYEPATPRVSNEKPKDNALERRKRRHSLNTSTFLGDGSTGIDTIAHWNEDPFDRPFTPTANDRSSEIKQRRASLSALDHHAETPITAPTSRSAIAKETAIPEASLMEIMQRVGITCTKAQVEKLELLGVKVQRKW